MTCRQQDSELTVADTLDLYLKSQSVSAKRESSVRTHRFQLLRFFLPALAEPLCTLCTTRLQQLAHTLELAKSHKSGGLLTSETLLILHARARNFGRWCVSQGYLRADQITIIDVSPMEWLAAEADRLRRNLEALRQEWNHLRQQLRAKGGER